MFGADVDALHVLEHALRHLLVAAARRGENVHDTRSRETGDREGVVLVTNLKSSSAKKARP